MPCKINDPPKKKYFIQLSKDESKGLNYVGASQKETIRKQGKASTSARNDKLSNLDIHKFYISRSSWILLSSNPSSKFYQRKHPGLFLDQYP